jgi:hypothetical protein
LSRPLWASIVCRGRIDRWRINSKAIMKAIVSRLLQHFKVAVFRLQRRTTVGRTGLVCPASPYRLTVTPTSKSALGAVRA